MARPWIATGALLVVMETLADFGTVAIFNYDTLTSGVYKAWFGLFSVHAAAQVASILILLAFFVLVLEQATRQRMRFATGQAGGDPGRAALRGRRAALATAACAAVFALAFAAPVLQLTAWGIRAGWNVVDGRLVRACLTLARRVDGRRITTVEGLGAEGTLSVLQRAFVEHGAIQCGFCTPGMLVAASALLEAHPAPSEAEIREFLAGNLCRCTGYAKIVAAIMDAAHATARS